MGIFILVSNCSQEHRYKNMAEFFKRLCSSVAWECCDEFNRIQLEVLSVLAIIISAIQVCRKKSPQRFKFPEGGNNFTDIELIPIIGYFITIIQIYSGRQQLPENLKILFRGVTMMAPNKESKSESSYVLMVLIVMMIFLKNSENYMNYAMHNYLNNNIIISVLEIFYLF